MKKILFAIGSMGHGGTESQLLHLIKNLDKNEFDISVFLMQSKGQLMDELKSLDITLYEGNFKPNKFRPFSYFSFFKCFFYLFWILIFNRFYLIQSYLPMVNFFAVIAGRLTCHRVWTGWRGMTYHQIKKPYLKILDSISNLLSNGINANARTILEDKDLKERFMSFKKSTVIKNYIPKENFFNISENKKVNERKKINIDKDDILLLCVSNLIPYKGYSDLLMSMTMLPKNFKLIFAGRDDGIGDDLHKYISKKDLRDRVRYLGYCNKKELDVFYQLADIYVCPSLTEGISNSIIEALIYELKIVATNAGGNSELLEDGKLGLICETSNPVDLKNKILLASKNTKNIAFDRNYIYSKYSRMNMLNCYRKSWKI